MENTTFIDLFAGAGGFGLGFQMAGFKPLLSVEVDKWASDTLKQNNFHHIVNKDITDISDESKIKALCKIKPSVIIGGPPCQGFSVAGANRVKDRERKNGLFRYYFKWVKVLLPEIFVIENVPGIISKVAKNRVGIFSEIKEIAEAIGYHISIWRLNAGNYGVPQNRNRVFIIGSRCQNNIPAPKPTHYIKDSNTELVDLQPAITVGEAILDLPIIKAKGGSECMEYNNSDNLTEYQNWARKDSSLVYNHEAMKHTSRIVKRYQIIIDGLEEIPQEYKVRKRNGGGELSTSTFNQNYRHLHPNKISYTIPASFYSSFIHPTTPRNITTREAARLQSFPDSYIFKGKRTQISNSLLKQLGKENEMNLSQYNQVGNAVPPLLAKAVAETLLQYL